MALADVDDVRRLMAKFPIAANSTPNELQIDSVIQDTEAEVFTALSSRNVVVPPASPQYFVDWLALLESYGATAAILKSMFPSASGPAETPAYAFWETRYRAGLKGIVDGSLVPSTVPIEGVVSGRIKPKNYFMLHPTEETDMGIHEPWFKRSFQG